MVMNDLIRPGENMISWTAKFVFQIRAKRTLNQSLWKLFSSFFVLDPNRWKKSASAGLWILTHFLDGSDSKTFQLQYAHGMQCAGKTVRFPAHLEIKLTNFGIHVIKCAEVLASFFFATYPHLSSKYLQPQRY